MLRVTVQWEFVRLYPAKSKRAPQLGDGAVNAGWQKTQV